MTRRDDTGELLEGDGTEDTMLDGNGDNTGDAGDRYRGSLRFGTTAAEASRGQSLDQLLAEEERRNSEREERLQQLHLTDRSDAALRERAVPSEEAEVHR